LVRPGLLFVALACCVAGAVHEWPSLRQVLDRLPLTAIAGAAVMAAVGSLCMMLSWRAVLADLGSALPVRAAARVIFVAQLARYVPGTVWAFAAQVELGRDFRVPRRRSASALVISLAVTLAVGLLTVAVALPLASAATAQHYWWVFAIAPVIAVGLWPPVLGRVLDRLLTLVRQQPLEHRPTGRGVLRAAGWAALGWLLWGLQSWFLVAGLTGRGSHVVGLAIGGYALAWCVGLIVVIFPGGIGPRELALIAAFAPVMGRADALAVALASRIVTTASDVGWAGLSLVASRRSGSAACAKADVPATGRHRQPGKHRKIVTDPEPSLTGYLAP
jgi:uncharacterized membrane protein YbhN (UPF0104 family)